MAQVSSTEDSVRALSSMLGSDVKTKFTNSDSGYASANGTLEDGTRFSVLEIDETKNRVVSITDKSGKRSCESTFPTSLATYASGNLAAKAFMAMR